MWDKEICFYPQCDWLCRYVQWSYGCSDSDKSLIQGSNIIIVIFFSQYTKNRKSTKKVGEREREERVGMRIFDVQKMNGPGH